MERLAMGDAQYKSLGLWIGAIVLASLILLALIPVPYEEPWEILTYAFLNGMLFTQPTLAAVWAGLGPGPLSVRIFGSTIWLTTLFVAIVAFVTLNETFDAETALLVFASILLQWLMPLPFLLASVWLFGLEMRFVSTDQSTSLQNQTQFGLRHVIILTSSVAILLAVAKAFVPNIPSQLDSETLLILVSLGTLNAVSQIPLVTALLLTRYAVPAVLAAVGFIVVVTVGELPVLEKLGVAEGTDYPIFYLMNAISSVFALIIAGIARLHGIRLIRVGHRRDHEISLMSDRDASSAPAPQTHVSQPNAIVKHGITSR